MKHLLLICSLLLAFNSSIIGQQSVKKFYNKYKHGENVTSVKLQGWMIKSVLSFTESFEGEDIIRKVSKLTVLTIEDGQTVSDTDIKRLVTNAKSETYEDLMIIREGTTRVRFMIKENEQKIKNLLVIIKDTEEFILIDLDCNLKWEDLKNIDFSNIDGGDVFDKIPSKKEEIPRA